MPVLPTILHNARRLQSGETTSLELVEVCLDHIRDPSGEGDLAFLEVDAESARMAARSSDQLRHAGVSLSPLMGIPISVKDLYDVAGQVTRAGSKLLANRPPADTDADSVALLRRAGAIIIGRTNMTEFAYSGLGLNPHYGTPASPYDRQTRRIPGGSSAGGAVSVADQMAVAGMGTDTGGSVRIPAAFCGITGFKPTARRVSTKGVLPLSSTYDSVGPMAPSVSCCITIDQILTQTPSSLPSPLPLKNLRLVVPAGIALDHLDTHVAAAFSAALTKLSNAGAKISNIRIDAIEDPQRPSNGGRLLSAEAYAWHRKFLEKDSAMYDPRVSTRMATAAKITAAEYIDLLAWRKDFLHQVDAAFAPFDAILLPTTPAIAPPIAELEASDERYFAANSLMLQNTSIINQVDGCALSVPCHSEGDAPVGLMIAGTAMQDERVLRIGLAVEAVLNIEP